MDSGSNTGAKPGGTAEPAADKRESVCPRLICDYL